MRKILAAAIMAWSFSAPTMAQTNDINLNTSCHAVSALYNMGDMVGLNETITVIKSWLSSHDTLHVYPNGGDPNPQNFAIGTFGRCVREEAPTIQKAAEAGYAWAAPILAKQRAQRQGWLNQERNKWQDFHEKAMKNLH
jgi:hypothetical protein